MFIDREEYRDRERERKANTHHYCSSCDSYSPIDEMDNYGRCRRCQEEYPFDEWEEE